MGTGTETETGLLKKGDREMQVREETGREGDRQQDPAVYYTHSGRSVFRL